MEIEKLTDKNVYSGSVTQTYIHSEGSHSPWFHYDESNYTSIDPASILLPMFDHTDLIPTHNI